MFNPRGGSTERFRLGGGCKRRFAVWFVIQRDDLSFWLSICNIDVVQNIGILVERDMEAVDTTFTVLISRYLRIVHIAYSRSSHPNVPDHGPSLLILQVLIPIQPLRSMICR